MWTGRRATRSARADSRIFGNLGRAGDHRRKTLSGRPSDSVFSHSPLHYGPEFGQFPATVPFDPEGGRGEIVCVLTGYNTDVPFEGTTYHVQTEDRGEKNPVIDTLVYCGGQILHQEKHSYAEILTVEAHEVEIARRLDRQHRDIVRRARHGEFARETAAVLPPEFSDGAFDLAIANFLNNDEECVWLDVVFAPAEHGGRKGGNLTVSRAGTGSPAAGALVSIRILIPGEDPQQLPSLVTDANGEAEIRWPRNLPVEASAVISAEAGPGGGKLRLSLANVAATVPDESLAPPVSS